MRQCDKGHFYDDNRFDVCPYCKDGTGLGKQAVAAFQNQQIPQFQPASQQPAEKKFKFCTKCGTKAEAGAKFCTGCGNQFPPAAPAPSSDIGKTVAVQPASAPATSDIGKTVAVQPMSIPMTSDIGKTVAVQPMTPAPSSDIGKTVAVQTAPPAPVSDIGKTVALKPMTDIPAPTSDIGKTVALKPVEPEPAPAAAPEKKQDKTRPVAFMVCIGGGNCGDAFKVSEGRNYIAGGSDADIKLDKDSSVSAECHAVVTYNPSNNKFTLSAGTGRGITYLNGSQVDVSADLSADDRIKVGGSELLFIPVCSDKFKWDEQT